MGVQSPRARWAALFLLTQSGRQVGTFTPMLALCLALSPQPQAARRCCSTGRLKAFSIESHRATSAAVTSSRISTTGSSGHSAGKIGITAEICETTANLRGGRMHSHLHSNIVPHVLIHLSESLSTIAQEMQKWKRSGKGEHAASCCTLWSSWPFHF